MFTIIASPPKRTFTNLPLLYKIFSAGMGTHSFLLTIHTPDKSYNIPVSAFFNQAYTHNDTSGYIATLDISTYIRAYAIFPEIPTDNLISQINISSFDTLHFYLRYGTDLLNTVDMGDFWHIAFPGYISENILNLTSLTLSNFTNPFLSVRTVSSHITLYEQEARNTSLPLFLTGCDITIRTPHDTALFYLSPGAFDTAVSFFNFHALNCHPSDNQPCNIDIIAHNITLATLSVIPNPVAEQYTILTFRNSFGFLENILLFGNRARKISVERLTFSRYSVDTGDYSQVAKTQRTNDTYSIASGYIEPYRIPLFIDLFKSDEVYINIDGQLFPALLKSDEISYDTIITSPLGFDIELTSVAPLLIPDSQETIPPTLTTEDEHIIITEDNFPVSI